ncbi:MAG: hypothetical protein Q4B08_07645 [Propionibacteriaceae bacterium]|nr:hypothetical protein [Propionibacteriaceae bacterium]
MPVSFATEVIHAINPARTRDVRGNVILDYDTPAERITLTGCYSQPGPSPEVIGTGRDVTHIVRTLYAPHGSGLGHHWAVELDGTRYLTDGEPLPLRSPTGRVSHDVIPLARWA